MNLTNPNPYAAENAPLDVCISLSRRNLVALLDLLDDPYAPGAILRKRLDNGFSIHVRAEEDDDHYGPTDQERDDAAKALRDAEWDAEKADAYEETQKSHWLYDQDEILDGPDENGYENYPTEDDDDC